MKRREFLKTAGIGMAAVGATGIARAKPQAEKPNIIFMMVDDLGKEGVKCCGAEGIETPHIDKLAAEGMRFTNAYCMPQCTPTRATLLTGQYPWRHGWINHWDVPRWGCGCHFDPKHNVSFARVMKSAGYATAAAGKWQINDFRVQPDAMKQHGFDEWCMWTGYETGNPPSGKRYWDPYVCTSDGSRTYEGRFGCDVFVDFLIDFMRRHRESPMLLYFPMALTHGPLVSTPAEPDATGDLARHRAMVRYTDAAVGRIVEALEELEIRDRTIVLFTTDNGTSRGITGHRLGRAVRGGKARLSENGVCAPFIVNGPGLVPAGRSIPALTDFTDLLPTLCELGGASLPEGTTLDGRSIADVILGRDVKGPREWIMALGHGPAVLDEEGVRPRQSFTDRVVRDARYKLWVVNGRSAKLFDLEEDPWEERNLLLSTDPEVVAARKRLEEVIASCPREDARPRYDPTPPQPWDRKPVVEKPGEQAGAGGAPDEAPPKAGFTFVGAHPDAAAQPHERGRILRTLVEWDGRLHVGFGDTKANTGPIAITPYDPSAGAYVPTGFLADTEAISVLRPIAGKLYAVCEDPKGPSDFAFGEPWANRDAVSAFHLYDVGTLDGSDLWLAGTSAPGSSAVAWRSTDGGATWHASLEEPPPAGHYSWYGFLGAHDGKMWVQAFDWHAKENARSAPREYSMCFDGRSWTRGPDLLPARSSRGYGNDGLDRGFGYRPVEFEPADRMVYSNGLGKYRGVRGGAATSPLYAFDGVEVEVVRDDALDFAVHGERLFVLGLDGEIHHTGDLVEWKALARAPDGAYSLGFALGRLFVGGREGELYRYDGSPPSR